MTELPRGTVTFVFTDIEASTALLKRLRDRYGDVLEEHQRILRSAFEAHDGREIDTQGDSFFYAFARARDAITAAVDAQRRLAAHDWPEGGEVRVRIGLHTGEPAVGEQRYVGFGVHRTARISAAGHGGQVLLSNATRELVEDDLPEDVRVRELGTYRLKDIERPERLFQLEIDGLRNDFPPLKAPQLAEPHPLRRRGVLVGALAGVVAAAVTIPIFAFGQGGSEGTVESAAGNSVGFIDSATNRLVADVGVGTTPTDVAAGDGAVWVTNASDGTVDRIDSLTHTVRQTIPVGNGPDGIAVGAGSVWVANGLDGTVSRIDPRSNFVTQKAIPVGNGPSGIAFGADAVWVVNRDDGTVSRIDPATGKVSHTFPVGGSPVDIAVAAGSLWVTSSAEGKVLRISPGNGAVVEDVGVGRGPAAVSAGLGAVWVANGFDGTVSRIDPRTSTVTATIPVGDGPSGIAAGLRGVWVALEDDGAIVRIDPVANRRAKSISIGSRPQGVASDSSGVFVAVRPAAGAHRGGTLIVDDDAYTLPGCCDPGVSYSALLSITNDGLTALQRVGGRESTEIVPDLAVSLPEPRDAGRTYTFQVRRGIRYSTGRTVRAGDFRRALERTFELRSDFAHVYTSIVGADACSRQPKGCDLSKGIEADDRTGTVTFHLRAPDPDFPTKLALPFAFAVPEETPSVRLKAAPATGPYRIAALVPKRQIRLVRNPRFREWSHAARPAGYPDEIVIRLDVPIRAQVRAVGRSEADLAELSNRGEPDVKTLRARYGSRLHSGPGPVVVYTFLNTRLAPFRDIRVRRALSYALDRDAVVRTAGGELFASPSCQVLPANFPAYRPYCPYRRDLAKAKRLVAASGTRGTPVVVWTRASYAKFYSHVVDALRALGFPARLKVVADEAYYDALGKAGPAKVQAGYVGWVSDYPSGGSYITSLLDYLGPQTGFSDNAVNRRIKQALELQQTDQAAANAEWARIDRMIVDQAPLVAMYNLRWIVFTSGRVGNFQYHPLWFTLLDQLWVR